MTGCAMTEDDKTPVGPRPPEDRAGGRSGERRERQDRLAAALRANLRKRKEQARQREQAKDGEGS